MTTHRQPFEQSTKSPPWARFATWVLLIAGVAAFVVAALLMAYASDDSGGGLDVSLVTVVLFVGGVAAAIVGLIWDNRLNKRDALATATGTVRERIETVVSALNAANTLMAELQAHMTAQVAAFDRFYAESESFEMRADLHRKEAQAVSDLVANAMERVHVTLARSHRRGQWLFFALGVLVAIPVVLLLSQLS